MRNSQSISSAAQSVDRDYLQKYKRTQSAPAVADSSSTTFLTSVDMPEYDDDVGYSAEQQSRNADPEESKRKAEQLTAMLSGSASTNKFDSALSQLSMEIDKKREIPVVRKAGARSWHTMPGRNTYLVADKTRMPFHANATSYRRPSGDQMRESVSSSSVMTMGGLNNRSTTVEKFPRHDCSPDMHGQVVALFPPYIRQHAMLAHIKDRTQTFVRKEPVQVTDEMALNDGFGDGFNG
jgi:hypothetical protein